MALSPTKFWGTNTYRGQKGVRRVNGVNFEPKATTRIAETDSLRKDDKASSWDSREKGHGISLTFGITLLQLPDDEAKIAQTIAVVPGLRTALPFANP